jgi:hypothetical protein
MATFDGQVYQVELTRRVATIRRIVDATHSQAQAGVDVSREARGMAIVLLFAAYENLLTSMCRGLLEVAASLRVGNRRLKAGFRLFAAHGSLQSIGDSGKSSIWRDSGRRLVEVLSHSKQCTINTDLFPADGSFMKRSQVRLFCDLFDLGDPGPILKDVWSRLDTIVSERNGIAHGSVTPEEVGRNYAVAELRDLITAWETHWSDFIRHAAARASSRDFFRTRW